MGVYSQYAAFEGGSAVVANESYVGAAGAYRMMEESSMNEHAIFEAVIGRDFAETYCALSGGTVVSESAVDALNEASLGGIWEKVVAFIQKIWEKIKGILKSVKDKIQSLFIRDGKALVNKYHKQIQKKITDGKLSKFKFKWRKIIAAGADGDSDMGLKDAFVSLVGTTKVGKNVDADVTMSELNKEFHDTGSGKTKAFTDRNDLDNEDILDSKERTGDANKDRHTAIKKVNRYDETDSYKDVRPYTTEEQTDMKEELLGAIVSSIAGQNVSSVTPNDFAKEFEDAFYDSVEELEAKDFEGMFNRIENVLKEYKKGVNAVEKEERATDKYYKEQKRKSENIQKQMSKLAGKDSDSAAAAAANRQASRAITCFNIIQECSGKFYASLLSCMKIEYKQCRAAYVKAATWNQNKAFEENAIFCEAVEDVSNYEVEEMFSCM